MEDNTTTTLPPFDYSRLSPENRKRADKYIKNLFRLQKAQAAVSATDSVLSAADSKLNKELRTLDLSPETTDIQCSFCGKHSDLCRKVIAGPKEVYICDECVDLCHEILEEELRDGDVD